VTSSSRPQARLPAARAARSQALRRDARALRLGRAGLQVDQSVRRARGGRRELVTTAGPADYVLFLDRQAVCVLEAKKKGTTLSGVESQTVNYQTHVPDELPALLVDGHLPCGRPTWLRGTQAEAIHCPSSASGPGSAFDGLALTPG